MRILNKKSIYIADRLHLELKALAMIEHCSMIRLIETMLMAAIRKKLGDLSSEDLAKITALSKSFQFLKKKKEDVYTASDGEKL